MRKIIKRKLCDTDTATHLGTIYVGEFGDPAGYEEVLYKTAKGEFFLYGIGGEDSKYPVETIEALTADEAKEF